MSKTNKELAVELYSAFLISMGNIVSIPNFSGTLELPTTEQMVDAIKEMTEKLSTIQDN